MDVHCDIFALDRTEYYLKFTSFLFKLGFHRGLNEIKQEANDSVKSETATQ